MSEALSEWLRSELLKFGQTHDAPYTESIVGRNVQIIHWLNSRVKDKDAWGEVSDKDVIVPIRISAHLATEYERKHRISRMTLLDDRGAVISLRKIQPRFMAIPHHGSTRRYDKYQEYLVLDILAFEKIGCEGEPPFGAPRELIEDPVMRAWHDWQKDAPETVRNRLQTQEIIPHTIPPPSKLRTGLLSRHTSIASIASSSTRQNSTTSISAKNPTGNSGSSNKPLPIPDLSAFRPVPHPGIGSRRWTHCSADIVKRLEQALVPYSPHLNVAHVPYPTSTNTEAADSASTPQRKPRFSVHAHVDRPDSFMSSPPISSSPSPSSLTDQSEADPLAVTVPKSMDLETSDSGPRTPTRRASNSQDILAPATHDLSRKLSSSPNLRVPSGNKPISNPSSDGQGATRLRTKFSVLNHQIIRSTPYTDNTVPDDVPDFAAKDVQDEEPFDIEWETTPAHPTMNSENERTNQQSPDPSLPPRSPILESPSIARRREFLQQREAVLGGQTSDPSAIVPRPVSLDAALLEIGQVPGIIDQTKAYAELGVLSLSDRQSTPVKQEDQSLPQATALLDSLPAGSHKLAKNPSRASHILVPDSDPSSQSQPSHSQHFSSSQLEAPSSQTKASQHHHTSPTHTSSPLRRTPSMVHSPSIEHSNEKPQSPSASELSKEHNVQSEIRISDTDDDGATFSRPIQKLKYRASNGSHDPEPSASTSKAATLKRPLRVPSRIRPPSPEFLSSDNEQAMLEPSRRSNVGKGRPERFNKGKETASTWSLISGKNKRKRPSSSLESASVSSTQVRPKPRPSTTLQVNRTEIYARNSPFSSQVHPVENPTPSQNSLLHRGKRRSSVGHPSLLHEIDSSSGEETDIARSPRRSFTRRLSSNVPPSFTPKGKGKRSWMDDESISIDEPPTKYLKLDSLARPSLPVPRVNLLPNRPRHTKSIDPQPSSGRSKSFTLVHPQPVDRSLSRAQALSSSTILSPAPSASRTPSTKATSPPSSPTASVRTLVSFNSKSGSARMSVTRPGPSPRAQTGGVARESSSTTGVGEEARRIPQRAYMRYLTLGDCEDIMQRAKALKNAKAHRNNNS